MRSAQVDKKVVNVNVEWFQTALAFKIHMPVSIKDVKRYKDRPESLGGPTVLCPNLY